MERRKEVDEYRRMELLGKYTAKLLYRWDNKKFEKKYLRKLEKKIGEGGRKIEKK